MLRKENLLHRFFVSSAATHTDEIGNPPHVGTQRKLAALGIPMVEHRARLMTREDGGKYDYILGMDSENLYYMRHILGERPRATVALLMDFTPTPRPIADPWYTGNFDKTYEDIREGLEYFLKFLKEEGGVPQ